MLGRVWQDGRIRDAIETKIAHKTDALGEKTDALSEKVDAMKVQLDLIISGLMDGKSETKD